MSDQIIAAVGRNLASALMARAHSRSAEDSKAVAEYSTELCKAVQSEQLAQAASDAE